MTWGSAVPSKRQWAWIQWMCLERYGIPPKITHGYSNVENDENPTDVGVPFLQSSKRDQDGSNPPENEKCCWPTMEPFSCGGFCLISWTLKYFRGRWPSVSIQASNINNFNVGDVWCVNKSACHKKHVTVWLVWQASRGCFNTFSSLRSPCLEVVSSTRGQHGPTSAEEAWHLQDTPSPIGLLCWMSVL